MSEACSDCRSAAQFRAGIDEGRRQAADEIERLRARRPVVCSNCYGAGVYSDDHPNDCIACPDCGKDGCGPGVGWSES